MKLLQHEIRNASATTGIPSATDVDAIDEQSAGHANADDAVGSKPAIMHAHTMQLDHE